MLARAARPRPSLRSEPGCGLPLGRRMRVSPQIVAERDSAGSGAELCQHPTARRFAVVAPQT